MFGMGLGDWELVIGNWAVASDDPVQGDALWETGIGN